MTDETQALELAVRAAGLARACGAHAAEATVSIARRFHAEARADVISKLEQSTARSLHVRLFVEGRTATLATSDLASDSMRDALRSTIAQAELVRPDEFAGLPEAFASGDQQLELYDESVYARSGDERVEEALELERLIRRDDPRIVNSSGSNYADGAGVTAIANTAGFAAAYRTTRASRSTGPVAVDGAVKRTAHYGTSARHLKDMESCEAVARIAADRAVALFGAKKPVTARIPVIFERDVAAGILADVFSAASAANIAIGNSWLAGRLGTDVGSKLVTIVDDGGLTGKLGSAPFDGEGVATQRTTIFAKGRLQTFLYDTYYARKLGASSTGNSTGGGIGATNLYLDPGSQTLQQVIASTMEGVLVLDTIGFATEHASGTYSRGARGFFIRDGELAYPIDEFTIAGTYAEMLAGVDAVCDDLRFDAAIVSPSFRVAEMMVSGH